MSQYRDDRSAARFRIESLEARVAEQEAELAARDALLASREATISRLRHRLGDGPSMDAYGAARASRALGLTLVTMASSAAIVAHMLHARSLDDGGFSRATAPSSVVYVVDASGVHGPTPAPALHADPLDPNRISWADGRDPFDGPRFVIPPAVANDRALPKRDIEATPDSAVSPAPFPIQRQVEPRVWGGAHDGPSRGEPMLR